MWRNSGLRDAFSGLSTPLVFDACLRLEVAPRVAPAGIRPVVPGHWVAGRVLPVRHFGSVDVFLEAMGSARPGEVLVIDNAGRQDESCIGDLVALEAQLAGLAGIVVWGTHRDTADLQHMRIPVFSYGACPAGPVRLAPRDPGPCPAIQFGEHVVTGDDAVFGDEDGVLFVPAGQAGSVVATARQIWQREREQAGAVRSGRSLREQLRFDEYLQRRDADPSYTFRQHLRAMGGAIEE